METDSVSRVNKEKKIIEDFAIRIMYFLNTMDSFLPFCVIAYFILSKLFATEFGFFMPFSASPNLILALLIFFYAMLKMGDFYPLFLIFMPLYFYLLAAIDPNCPLYFSMVLIFMLIFTSLIQVIFMGIPMGLAARRIDIPLRIYFNSFFILSPTTISLSLSVIYPTFLICASKIISENFKRSNSWGFLALFILTALVVAKSKRKNIPLVAYHPAKSPRPFKRVVLLNIDGLSYNAFKKSQAEFLKEMEEKFCGVRGGARTVYRALTNPAFVSILTGTPPEIHGVRNNNLGQKIMVEALPDFIKTRLYGSMHVRHFSRKNWEVNVFSLVELGYDKTDTVIMEELKKDILKDSQTKFWVVDLSQVDYAGHSWGSYSREYYDAIAKTDCRVRDFVEWMQEKGLLEETMAIISSDHGLFIGEHSFLIFRAEEFVPLIFMGKGIFPMQFSFPVSIMDISANVSYFLGERYCGSDNGRVFDGMFKDSETVADFKQRLGFTK